MISVIMPSYLGAYRKSAKDREMKLRRAVKSVIYQEYDDWELIVVADGCERTMEIIKEINYPKIKLISIDKQTMWSGAVRNVGLEETMGEWKCYLDNDDFLHPCHLYEIACQGDGADWLFFNDYVLRGEVFKERKCQLQKFQCGTANIAHKIDVKWPGDSAYGWDDWMFIQRLMSVSDNYKVITGPAYLVCHIPNRYDV